MSRSNKESFGQYFELPNSDLSNYFKRVRDGQPKVFRTSFYEGRSMADILQAWNRILKPIEKKWPSLYEFEDDLRKKVGPMSVMLPLSQRIPDIDSYYDHISYDQEPISNTAILSVLQEWDGVPALHIRSQSDTVKAMKKSTSSGNPFYKKRRRVVDDTLPVQIERLGPGNYVQRLGSKRMPWKTCAILGWRGQEGGPEIKDVKQRVVWMFPFAVNIEELRVYQVMIEAAQRHNLTPAWVSMEAVDKEITLLFDSKSDTDLIVCTDFSKFDQTFNPVCQEGARQIIKALFDDSIGDWLEHVFPIKYDIPLAYDYGKIRHGKHGMGSGSGGTNADETLLHRALQHEAALRNAQSLNLHSMCLGDDGILTYPGITAEQVVETYTKHGLVMNPDKQYVSAEDCTYLRRWHHKDYRMDGICVGVYSTFRALGRLCMQERYYDPKSWGPKMVALRQLSILENCKYHPLREQFADFCMKGDKYRLGIDIPGFLDNIESEAKEAIDHMPDFLGYTRSVERDAGVGLQHWWIVSYLKSKR
nr:MAG: putative RNA-dependent RNA polymerase [Picobirnavirus sp.]